MADFVNGKLFTIEVLGARKNSILQVISDSRYAIAPSHDS